MAIVSAKVLGQEQFVFRAVSSVQVSSPQPNHPLQPTVLPPCVFRGCRSTSPRDAGPGFRRMPVQWRAGRMYFG